MKKLLKKLFCLTMALCLTCTCVACGTPDDDTPTIPPASEGTLAQIKETYGDWTDEALEVKAIDKGLGVQWIKDAASTFNKATGSKITVLADETLNEGVANFIEADSGSDVYFTFTSDVQWVRWSQRGLIVPISDIESTLDFKVNGFEQIGIYNGQRYIMPYVTSPSGLVYNQNYVNEIPSKGEFTTGTFPTTWQGLLDMCDSINEDWNKTVGSNKVVPFTYGGSVGDMDYVFFQLWAQIDPDGYKAYYDQDDLDITGETNKSLLVSEGAITALDCIAKLFNTKLGTNGYYPSNTVSTYASDSNLVAEQKFLNGQSVFTITGDWFENEMRDYIDEVEADFYHFTTMPVVKAGGQSTISLGTPSTYFMIAANGKNNNDDLAKKFLSYMASPDVGQIYMLSTGSSNAFECEVPEGLSPFAQEVMNAWANSRVVVGGSGQIPHLTCAIGLQMAQAYKEIATSAYTETLAREKIERLYEIQYAGWNDCVKDFVE
ncbi:MAG: extracellular solute-binding protein [Clostridiales bacterium]|nr:extracellular solute-binding protein [Clostridiales bacterium]